MNRFLIPFFVFGFSIACSDDPEPVPNPGPPAPCSGETELFTGRCVAGFGAQVACADGTFSLDHSWAQEAATLRFVSQGGSGDGSAQSSAAASIEAAISGAGDDVVVLLDKGNFDVPAQLPAKVSLIGRCPGETSVSLGLSGSITRHTGEQLKLWGLSLVGDPIGAEEALVVMRGEGRLEAQHVHFSGSADGLRVQGEIVLSHNTFGALGGRGINATGALSGIIIGDNHFLGPLGGDGVFLGPLGGDGVFKVTGNSFGSIVGSGVIAIDARSGIIIGDNHFLGPLGGDGVFVGPASGGVEVNNNRFESVAGDALVLQEVVGDAQVTANQINPPIAGSGGAGIALLDLEGGVATVSGNTINGATSMALVVERVSSEVRLNDNLIEGTVPPLATGGNHLRAAYGVAIMDSREVFLTNNQIRKNATAGVVYDMAHWRRVLRRPELGGLCELTFEGNQISDNNDSDLILQNSPGRAVYGHETHWSGERDEILPVPSRQGRTRCGDGRISGLEECDPGDTDSPFGCAEDCRMLRDQHSASGQGFSCFIDTRHEVYCVGQNVLPIFTPGVADPVDGSYEILGPTRVELPPGVNGAAVALAAGRRHLCALTLQGTVFCWGDWTRGQVGDCLRGDSRPAAAKTVMKDQDTVLSNVSGLSAYGDTTCAWTSDDELYCWGDNSFGQTGQGAGAPTISACAERVTVNDGADPFRVQKAVVGDQFTCGVAENGKTRCFGRNDNYQLGVPITETCSVANVRYGCSRQPAGVVEIAVQTPLIADHLSAGNGACALTPNQEMFCWGPKYYASIPLTENAHLFSDEGQGAAQCVGLVGAKKVALGRQHGCLIDLDSKLKCWSSSFGALWSGEADHNSITTPDYVLAQGEPINAAIELTVGETHTCLLEQNRSISCWGDWPSSDGTMETEQLRHTFELSLP